MDEVALVQMLEARERRAFRQRALLAQYGKPLVCFTMNIAGPVKNTPLIARGFAEGCRLLRGQFAVCGAALLHREETRAVTGNEAFFVVDMPPLALKRLTVRIEDGTSLGRLYDMDVLRPDGSKVEREELALPPRPCLICGRPARACARSRTHTVAELQEKTRALLQAGLSEADAKLAAELAVRALLDEVCTTPKPGLVDRENSGSHRDMDIFTFMHSASALWPYFARCCMAGRRTAAQPAPETFAVLRSEGLLAEADMRRATGGVNTHKGAIFSLGLLCGALGRLPRTRWGEPEALLSVCAEMTAGLTARDYGALTAENARTAGQKLYLRYGLTGVRGQAEAGFPAVREQGLPKLEALLAEGKSLNDAGCAALLTLLAAATDTNMIARGGPEEAQASSRAAAALLEDEPCPRREALEQLDRAFIEKNLSPGGSADLLALCYFLHFLKDAAEKEGL